MDEEVEYCRENFTGEELNNCYISRINQRTLDEFLQGSQQAADASEKIIVWQENGLVVRQKDQAAYIDQARELAMQENVYLVMGTKMVDNEKGERKS